MSRFIQYGIPSDLANKIENAGLTVSKAKALGQKDMVKLFGLSHGEAKLVSTSVKRKEIEKDVASLLLSNSNYMCCICKGCKGISFIIHHIEPYELTQDNSYRNLVVLCPTCHDLAHQGGLTLSITKEQLVSEKSKWELYVEKYNAQQAAHKIDVDIGAIDYVNVMRIEAICHSLFGKIPNTTISHQLKRAGILNRDGVFDQKYVKERLSSGKYLFDYTNCQETEHYQQLMAIISEQITFVDMDEAIAGGCAAIKELEGKYAYFIGGVYSTRPAIPITNYTEAIVMHYSRGKVKVEWVLDPNYLMSMSAISRQGSKNRYIIYSRIGGVERDESKFVSVKASPLFIAWPTKYINKTPGVAFRKYETSADDEASDDVDEPSEGSS